MAGRLAGKVAIVTGAGQGNGRAIALAFANEGANVACADYHVANARAVAEAIKARGAGAIAVEMDVSRAADCERTVRETQAAFGGVDILVNNAGIWIGGTALTLTEEQWERLHAVNVKGVFLMSKAALPAIIARGGGSVIHIASQAGLRGSPGSLTYIASKHAVVGMTRAMALDHGAQGVRVNAICPGLIETPMGQQVLETRGRDAGGAEAARRQALEGFPLGRIGQPEDVAAVAVHLASDEASWTTGDCYSVDGGAGLYVRR